MPPESTAAAPAPAPESTAPVEPSAPAAPAETPAEPAQPSEAAQVPATSDNSSTDNNPQATDPAIVPDATPDGDTPDRGVDPDKGIDPDKDDTPVETPAQDATDPSQMTEAQKNAYYYQLRNAAKVQTEKALDAQYHPEALDDVKERYMQQGYDEFQAEMLADRDIRNQQTELAEIRAEVADLNAGLVTEGMEVVMTIPWLNPAQKDAYGDGKLADLASRLYENFLTRDARTAQIDPRTQQPIPGTGQIIEARMTPMQFYGALDRIRSSGASTAQVQAQRNAERQMASVAAPASTTSTRETPFEKMTPAEQRAELERKGHVFN